MKQYNWTATALVVFLTMLSIALASPTEVSTPFFSCSHDAGAVRQVPLSALPRFNATVATETRTFPAFSTSTDGKRQLKVLVKYYLDDACSFENQVVPAHDGSGGSVTCSAADVLTVSKRNRLESALSTGLEFLSSALYSVPTGSISVGAGACPGIDNDAFVAEDHDYVLFVTASPRMQSGGLVLAWGLACASVAMGMTARPVVGHINFVPSGIGSSTAQLEASLAAHEVTHALGFTSLYATLNAYVDESGVWQQTGGTATVYRPGLQKDVHLVKTPRVVQAARKHFGCDTLDGVEIEDMGDGGTAGSHWKKRILFQEALVGVVSSVKLFYTSITLAFFEDAGFYTVDYSVAEDQLAWGYQRGCPFLYQNCKTLGESYGFDEFCFDSDKDSVEKCTLDHLSIGHCEVVTYANPLPSENQYFPDAPERGGAQETMDYCPFRAVYSNGNCLDGTMQDDRQDGIQNIYGNVYGPSSQCFESSLVTAAFPVMKTGARCLPATCTAALGTEGNEQALLVSIQQQTVLCPTNGSAGRADVAALYGTHGQLTCPAASIQCRGQDYSGISPQLQALGYSASNVESLFTRYTYGTEDDCDTRRQRCIGYDNNTGTPLTALLPACTLFVERAQECFGRRCHATFQEWMGSHARDVATAEECRSSMADIASRCVDGWEGATALCHIYTDGVTRSLPKMRRTALVVAVVAVWIAAIM